MFQMAGGGLDEDLAIAGVRTASMLVGPAELLDKGGVRRLVEHAPCALMLVREARAET